MTLAVDTSGVLNVPQDVSNVTAAIATVHVLQLQTDDPDIFEHLTKEEWKALQKARITIK